MAKKRVEKAADGRARRKQRFTRAEIQEIADEISTLAGQVASIAAQMQQNGIREIGIDGAGKADTGMKLIRQFIGKASLGLTEALIEK